MNATSRIVRGLSCQAIANRFQRLLNQVINQAAAEIAAAKQAARTRDEAAAAANAMHGGGAGFIVNPQAEVDRTS